MPLSYPAFAWGAVEDFSAWTKVGGTGTVTSSVGDPFAGTGAYTLNDTDAGNFVYWKRAVTVATRDIWQTQAATVCLMMKAGTSALNQVLLVDSTAGGAGRGLCYVTWSAGVPTLSDAGGLLAITSLTPLLLMLPGWYLIRFRVFGLIPGNAHEVRIVPATFSAATTGTVTVFNRRFVVSGSPFDNFQAGSVLAPGSIQAQSTAGVEDAWVWGRDETLAGELRYIPVTDTDTPYPATGWDGGASDIGINVGVKGMIEAGQDKQLITLFPDRTGVSMSDQYLVDDGQTLPTVEPNGTRRLMLRFRNRSYAHTGVGT